MPERLETSQHRDRLCAVDSLLPCGSYRVVDHTKGRNANTTNAFECTFDTWMCWSKRVLARGALSVRQFIPTHYTTVLESTAASQQCKRAILDCFPTTAMG
jgi:hypothetical protein